jgi:ComEC/Rec2-related protein
MLYRAIYLFFISAIITKIFNLDFYSFCFFILLFLLIFFLIKSIFGKQNKIENNSKEYWTKKIIRYVFYLSFMFLGNYLVLNNPKVVSPLLIRAENVEFTGKVVSLDKTLTDNKVIFEVEKIKQSDGETSNEDKNEKNTLPSQKKMYAEIHTSMFQKIELYEIYKVTGKTSPLFKNDVTEKRPLFFYYETDKLNYDVSFIIKYNVKLEKIDNQKSYLEIILKDIKDLSFKLKDIVRKNLDEPYGAIANGVTLGDTNFFTDETRQTFTNSGLIHLMVLSGTNISILFFSFWFLFRSFNPKLRIIFSIILIWIFIIMTGLNAPAIRAGIMATFLISGNFFKRKINLFNSLFFSLFLLTLYDINSLFYNPSLHLSFLASFAIFIMAPFFYNFLNLKFQKNNFHLLKILIAVTLAILLTTTPYILGMVGKFGTGGLFLTFLAEPITFAIMLATSILILFFLIFNLDFLNLLIANFITFFAKIFLNLATIGANYFPQIKLEIGKNFLIIYYLILFTTFIFFYLKKEKLK